MTSLSLLAGRTVEKKPICHKELLPLDHIEKIEKSSSNLTVSLP